MELERTVFSSDDPFEINEALVEKAFCYKQCGRFQDAVSTLGRVRMYMLEPADQAKVLYERELCCYLAGDAAAAAAYIDEADAAGVTPDVPRLVLDAVVLGECGRWDESQARAEELMRSIYEGEALGWALTDVRTFYCGKPKLKNVDTAISRAFLPPLGHLYTGNGSEGALSAALNLVAAAWCVWQCAGGNWISGLLGGGMALNYTFMGNLERSSWLVEKYNHDVMREFNDSLRKMILSHSEAE